MHLGFMLASSWQENGSKGEGGYAGKDSPVQAKRIFAANSEDMSYRGKNESNSCEPRPPLPSNLFFKAQKAQAAFEYHLLLLLAAVLIVSVLAWAAGFSSSQAEMNANASEALTNMSSRMLPPAVADANYSDASSLSLEISAFEPYFSNQPAFFQVVLFSPGIVSAPTLQLSVKNAAGANALVEPSSFASSSFSFSRAYSTQFHANATGVYTITASCGNATARRDVIVR